MHEQLKHIKSRIEKACREWERSASSVTLVAASKYQSTDKLEALLSEGHRCFGENRVQEASDKWPELKARYPDIALHLIGPLQTNKVKQALSLFDVIETIDRTSLVDEIAKHLPNLDHVPHFYLQVNIGEEEQKGGVLPEKTPDLLDYCKKRGLKISGLMCIPPHNEAPGPYFGLLNKLATNHGIKILSMGMSSDFETAISLGATHIRVGTALFGDRS
jgi:pyridoxal phosphate enzyme (YggS family)